MGVSLRRPRITMFLAVFVDDIKMVGKKENWRPMRDIVQNETIWKNRPVVLSQVFLSCTQKESQTDHSAAQATAHRL